MTYTKKQFLEDVKKEAVALKKNATKEELNKLEAHLIKPTSFQECVYGLMTNDCRGERASELIFNCCPRYFEYIGINVKSDDKVLFDDIRSNVNGKHIEGITNPQLLMGERVRCFRHFSAIETYILYRSAKLKNLIDFLKGNRKDLVL